MRSDALPPARNCHKPANARAVAFFGLLALSLTLPFFTACSAAHSAVTPQKAAAGQAPTPSDQTPAKNLKLSGDLPAAEIGKPYSATINVSGKSGDYDFNLSWGSLPAGLSLHTSTGVISGTPSKKGTFEFGVHVVDKKAKRGGAEALKIAVSDTNPVTITLSPNTATVPSAARLQFTATVVNTSNTGVTWSATVGSINNDGLYQAPAVKSNTTATVKAISNADSSDAGTASVTITPDAASPLTITTTGLTGVTSGITYSANLKASGGSTPYSWTLVSGSLPTGFSLSSSGSLAGTTTKLGQFNFTVQATDSSSPAQTAKQALTLTVSSQTGNGKGVQQSFFNAGFNGSKVWPPTDGQNQAATLAGVRLWDDGIKWGQLNTANGVYNWSGLDKWLDRADSAHMDVLYTFGDTPQFAVGKAPGGCSMPGEFSCGAPTDVNSDGTGTDAMFQAFVTALVTHAAGRISYYELWNEPDYKGFWSGTTAQLVRMGKDAAAIIRSLDPNAKILSPSAHGPTMSTWFDGYVAAGGAPNFDIVNVHMRGQNGSNGTPESFLDIYSQVITETQKRNLTSLPLWDDEHGILTGQGVTDPDLLAGYVAREAVLRASVGIQRQYVYTWDSHAPYGLQGNASGTAWNQVATWLIGHTISACTVTGTVYTCNLDNGMIVWDTSKSCSNGVCAHLELHLSQQLRLVITISMATVPRSAAKP